MSAVISDLLRRYKEPNGYGSLRCKSRSYNHAASISNYESRDVSTPLDMTSALTVSAVLQFDDDCAFVEFFVQSRFQLVEHHHPESIRGYLMANSS